MTLNDIGILLKKILVGIIVYLVPVVIIFGGLWLTKRVFSNHEKAASSQNYSIEH